MDTKVSVVMAVYNSERFLDESISSVLDQTLNELELIIVDDCSNDRSRQIIERWSNKDSRIKVLTNSVNLGPCRSRNKAIEVAEGKYVAILDSDDACFPNRLEVQSGYLDRYPEIALVGCGALKVDEQGMRLGRHTPIANWYRLGKRLTRRNRLYHSTVMYRQLGYRYREKLASAEDYDLYLQMLSDGLRLAAIPEPLVIYRMHSESLSGLYAGKQKLLAKTALQFYEHRIEKSQDDYERFDPAAIMEIDSQSSDNRVILKYEIKASLQHRDLNQMRSYCKRYFRAHGYNVKLYFLYLTSFGMDCFSKTINSIKSRY
jgi:glycosyltransferase involved in cell wall biosynthesis